MAGGQGKQDFAAANVGGIDVIRLHHPNLDQMNPDFLCGSCKSK